MHSRKKSDNVYWIDHLKDLEGETYAIYNPCFKNNKEKVSTFS